MARYMYTAENENGETTQGFLDAENEVAARSALEEMNLTIHVIKSFEDNPDADTLPTVNNIAQPVSQTQSVLDPSEEKSKQAAAELEHVDPAEDTTVNWSMENDSSKEMEVHTPSPEQIAQQQTVVQTKQVETTKEVKTEKQKKVYFPFIDTLRLYTGWLLALCTVFYALASYQTTRSLPFSVPFVDQLFNQRNIILFVFGWFLFFFCTSVYRRLGRNIFVGILVLLIGGGAFYVYQLNI